MIEEVTKEQFDMFLKNNAQNIVCVFSFEPYKVMRVFDRARNLVAGCTEIDNVTTYHMIDHKPEDVLCADPT